MSEPKPLPIYRRGRYWYVDLRRYDAGRPTMRDPSDPNWPEEGERTEFEDVAEEWAKEYQAYYRNLMYRRQVGKLPVLGSAVDVWLRHRASRVAKSTWDSDRSVCNHLVEEFGHRGMPSITSDEMQQWFNRRLENGTTVGTLRNYRGRIRSLWRHFDLNPPTMELPEDKNPVVYFIQCRLTDRIKIGVTDNIERRWRVLRSSVPTPVELLGAAEGDEEAEKALHDRLDEHRVKGEWFDATAEVLEVVGASIEQTGMEVLGG